MISTFRFSQSLLIFLTVVLWVLLCIGAIQYFNWHLVFAPGLLIHSGIILLCIGSTVAIIPFYKRQLLFDALNFKQTRCRYYFYAIVIAIFLWVADYCLQLFYFLDNGNTDALEIKNDIKLFGTISVVIAICLLAPVAEEILFRQILLNGLANQFSAGGSVLITSLLFAAIHFSENDFATLFFAAVFYATLTLKAESIWPAILAHSINNSVTVYYLSTL